MHTQNFKKTIIHVVNARALNGEGNKKLKRKINIKYKQMSED